MKVTQMFLLCHHQVCGILTFTDTAAIKGTAFQIRTCDNGTELGPTSPSKPVQAAHCFKFSLIGKLFLKLVSLTVKNFSMFLQRVFIMILHPMVGVPSISFPFQMSITLLHCPFQHAFCDLRKRSPFRLLSQEQLSIPHFTPIILLCTYSI